MSKPGTNTAYLERVEDGIAIVTLDHYPMNALGTYVRNGLTVAIREIEARKDIKGVVVRGAGQCFCSGADIAEFSAPPDVEVEKLDRKVTDFCGFEGCSVPVVAAIHTYALGGGFELALGCHYRVLDSKAVVGLPEINIGLLPGGQGTQRLPRLIGADNALKLITSGQHVSAKQALEWGVVDLISQGDLLKDSIAFCKTKIGQPTRQIYAMPPPQPVDFKGWTKQVIKTRPGEPAAVAIVKCVEAACAGPTFEAGDKVEKQEFFKVMRSPESNALRYMFFAERAGSKVKGLTAKAVPIEEVGIIGAGLMGGGIAMCCANVGIRVVLLDMNPQALAAGLKVVDANYERSVKSGSRPEAAVRKARALITGVTDYSALNKCDLVVEAVFEDMDLKKKIFTQLDQVTKPTCFLCTNTSFLDIDEIASATKRPDRVMGTHFFSPANVMKLLENVRGRKTSDETIASLMEWGKRIGKWVILVGNCDGFVGNRMMALYSGQARTMLEEGATPSQVDGVALEFGMRMGPLAVADLVGIDLGSQALKKKGLWSPSTTVPHALVEAGRLGQKAGKGYFDYVERKQQPSPQAQEIIRQVASNKKVSQRELSKTEIEQRLFFPLINEGFKILEEGMAQNPADVDVCYVHGYSWPRYRGGPMLYADQVGLAKVLAGLEALKIQPAGLLRKCVAEKTTLAKYWKANGDAILGASRKSKL
jgi:3-hydroxyacyl-CoA dehydrogenase